MRAPVSIGLSLVAVFALSACGSRGLNAPSADLPTPEIQALTDASG